MLNSRQIKMLNDFYQHQPQAFNSKYFSNKYTVSIRTIQSDIKKIKQDLRENKVALLISKQSVGSHLRVLNNKKFKEIYFHPEITKRMGESSRVRELCKLLLEQRKSLTKSEICSKLYISKTTLTSDLNKLTRIVKPFSLRIDRSSQNGVRMIGSERNFRRCFSRLGLESLDSGNHLEINYRRNIENILISVLMKYRYRISDTLFQNLIVHIEISIRRIKSGFLLKKENLNLERKNLNLERKFSPEVKAAKEIFTRLERRFLFKANDAEIINLAIYLRGKSDYQKNSYVTKEVNQFIVEDLEAIKEKFNVDFTQEINLRISLALHIMPLITRMQYDIQNNNSMLNEIRSSFPLAFDMAAYTGMLLQQKVGKKIAESEIAYLAIYFNQYLTCYNSTSGSHKVLVITFLKRSESVLLRQRLITWFDKDISVLTIVNINDLSQVNLDEYDVIFTTHQTALTDKLGAMLISDYPTEDEYSKIRLEIDGFKNKKEILSLFNRKRFAYVDMKTKSQVLDEVFKLSQSTTHNKIYILKKAVQLRENLGSSFFGSTVALPHPVNPLAISTFVTVVLLRHPVKWDKDGNMVDLVLLVVIEKNNAKVFQLWNYLAKIIQDKTFVERLKKNPTFKTFIELFSELLS